jgi:hypothetical protein
MPAQLELPPDLVSGPPRRSLWQRLTSSRFLFISIAVHLLFGLVATVMVVQRLNANRKLTFKGGPPSPNKSTRAIEHKVQMAKKQSTMSAPAPVKRITTTGVSKVTLPSMPAMPKMDAAPSKMAGVGGAGVAMPSAIGGSGGSSAGGGVISLFGLREASGGSLVGTFYDLKQNPSRQKTDMNAPKYEKTITDFVHGGFNEGLLQKYYRAPVALHANAVFTPMIRADEGPKAFNAADTVKPGLWVVLYKGRVAPPESGVYHFVGAGDDIMIVRLNGQVVLDRCYNLRANFAKVVSEYHYDFSNIPGGFAKGEGVALTAGNFTDIDILIGEEPGGEFFADLLVEKEGVSYEKDSRGNPILPPFALANVKMPALQAGQKLPPFATNAPIWKAEKRKN